MKGMPITKENYDRIKRAMEEAEKTESDSFAVILNGERYKFLVSYAKYLLEYMEGIIK